MMGAWPGGWLMLTARVPGPFRSADPLRSSTAASILANIHYHPDNATVLYKAELKLKYAALLTLQGKAVQLAQCGCSLPLGRSAPE